MLTKPVVLWVSKERDKLLKVVNRDLWRIANSNHLLLFMYFWKRSVFFIQKAISNYSKIRQARILAITKIYNRIVITKKDRRVTVVPGYVGSNSILNPEKKRKLVLEYLKTYLANYCKETYQESINSIGGTEDINEKAHKQKTFRLYSDKEAMISFFLGPSSAAKNSFQLRKRKTDFLGFSK